MVVYVKKTAYWDRLYMTDRIFLVTDSNAPVPAFLPSAMIVLY